MRHHAAPRDTAPPSKRPYLRESSRTAEGGRSERGTVIPTSKRLSAKLASIYLTGKCTNAKALETLPALNTLTARATDLDDPTVLERLAARGVEIHKS